MGRDGFIFPGRLTSGMVWDRRFRVHCPLGKYPVVFITAHDSPTVRAEAEAVDCAGYFSKTGPGSMILETIHRAIAGGGMTVAQDSNPS